MMSEASFYYRIPGRTSGHRPGAHGGHAVGTGNDFKSHARLTDCPDPRRIDLRASLSAGRDEWLVRLYRQRAAVPVHAVVDMSASMDIGRPCRKLHVAAAFVEAMGNSAFKVGDPAGLCAFDVEARNDLYMPARHNRGAGKLMASRIAQPVRTVPRKPRCGLVPALQTLAGRQALVFLVSDFHLPAKDMTEALDLLERAWVVPVVIWDASEIAPPQETGFVRMRDAEGGGARPVWINAALRDTWMARVEARRRWLDALFASRQLRPVYMTGAFDAQVLSRYFLDAFT